MKLMRVRVGLGFLAVSVLGAAFGAGDLREQLPVKDVRRPASRMTVTSLTKELAPRLAALAGTKSDEVLWTKVRADLSEPLLMHWQRGELLGSRAEQAFFVKCDRTTMTQADIDAGVVKVLVGFAAVKPAEFEIFTLQQSARKP